MLSEKAKNSAAYCYPIRSVLQAKINEKSTNNNNNNNSIAANSNSNSSTSSSSSSPHWLEFNAPINHADLGLLHLPSLTPAVLLAQPSRRPQEDNYSKIAEPPDSPIHEEPREDHQHFVNFRYQAAQDEHGNHVVIGRDGKLEKCEDEPIRTPGAVQAFGVLIAVQQTEEALIVRQVSENSTELLGLSPRYLFSLRCFTDTLPETQADLLWDNIQFLSETSPNPQYSIEDDSGSENPHIFLLSGYSAPNDDGPSSDENRKMWKCWCAMHRPPLSGSPRAPLESRDLVILEFEFEKDTVNPLYPPSKTCATQPSAIPTSPFSPSSFPSSLTSSVSADSDSASLSSQSVVSNQQGLEGDDDWLPSAEDILASTTPHAKPVPALERLRRTSEAAFPSSDSDGSSPSPSSPARFSSARRARRRRGTFGSRSGGQEDRIGIGIGMMDIFAVVTQINEQFGSVDSLEEFLNVVVGILKDLTQFHRVLVYRFDEEWNGQVMSELVDWNWTRDLYRGLHFPASDIPAQARALYAINKVRLLYDRSQSTARIVARSKADLEVPLNMTHSHLRAMSPIHIKYLANMGIRASMSISIMAFGQLWGLISCHSYGSHGMRVSFPVRQMLRLISQSVSRNIERLSYAQRLHTRKLVSSFVNDHQPTGYIVSNADDLLSLFDADFGILVIGEGAKILGDEEPSEAGQEILIMAEYLRIKQFREIQASHCVSRDFSDLHLTAQFKAVAGVLVVPLSSQGRDFIAFLRKGQPTEIKWAGRPYKTSAAGAAINSTWMRPSDGSGDTPTGTTAASPETSSAKVNNPSIDSTSTSDNAPGSEGHTGGATQMNVVENAILEPRKSFKIWSEMVAGKCREWTDEHLETAGVLALVYGKFIEVWRQKESAIQTTRLTNLLLSNASHEVRTPLNHIINYLEMALNGPLDSEARENLSRSHEASKSLLFTINDLLDLTRLESGNETIFNEPFDLRDAIEQATHVYKKDAERRNLNFTLDLENCPRTVIGDAKKIQTVVQNLTANSFKYTDHGKVTVHCRTLVGSDKTKPNQVATEIIVEDSGCGIPSEKLDNIFREFEQVEQLDSNLRKNEKNEKGGVGLGLAVVARVVSQLGGQLRVESKIGEGTRVSFLIPLSLPEPNSPGGGSSPSPSLPSSIRLCKRKSGSTEVEEIGNLMGAFTKANISGAGSPWSSQSTSLETKHPEPKAAAIPDLSSQIPVQAPPTSVHPPPGSLGNLQTEPSTKSAAKAGSTRACRTAGVEMRILIVEDNDINRNILAKRLTLDGHTVIKTINGQECVDICQNDIDFDIILMDLQMPILDGYEASKQVRIIEQQAGPQSSTSRTSHDFNKGRLPIFAVSASLPESQRIKLINCGMDGWMVKPIDFRRLRDLLKGVMDQNQKKGDIYHPGYNWEVGGWLSR